MVPYRVISYPINIQHVLYYTHSIRVGLAYKFAAIRGIRSGHVRFRGAFESRIRVNAGRDSE